MRKKVNDIQVEVLKRFGSQATAYRKWLKTWLELGQRVFSLPEWMQAIVLDDVSNAIKNRVAVMEMIQRHGKRSR